LTAECGIFIFMNGEKINTQRPNIFVRMHPLQRLLTSLLLTAVVFFLLSRNDLSLLLVTIILWDVFSFSYILMCWIVLFTRPVNNIMQLAREEDGTKFFVIFMVLVTSFASMFTVLLLLISKDPGTTGNSFYIPLTIAGMMLSWVMVHTLFAFHYAHKYYDDLDDKPGTLAEGLDFPNEKTPDYLDFAYFSFIIGMTFQVSDVEVTSKKLRRIVLVHSLIAFVLNTFVVALTINLIAGLKK